MPLNKRFATVLAASLSISVMSGCATKTQSFLSGRWVDLSHEFSDATIYWPNAEHFHLQPVFDGTTAKGYHYSANSFKAAEHGGTHMDAPIHFKEGAATVEQMPVEAGIGPGVVVDVSSKALKNPDYLIGIDDLEAFEKTYGLIPAGSVVLLHTGYDRYWPDPVKYLGTAERGEAAIAKLHLPGLAPEAAGWLAEKRHIKAVGLDTASIDYGQSTEFKSHRVFAKYDIAIFENLAGLGKLPAKGSTIIALPMKIQGGSGAPLRAVAFLPDR